MLSQLTQAHVSTSNPVLANSSQIITLNVPHGCQEFDTSKVEVSLPIEFKLTRPIDNVFGKAKSQKSQLNEPFELYGKTYTSDVRSLTWSKNNDDILESDTKMYQFSFRSRIPNTPYKKYYIPTIQSCKAAGGETLTNEWVFPGSTPHGSTDKPAPTILVIPKYTPGWNKYTITENINDLSVFEGAYIVWAGESAYSNNPTTQKQIEDTPDIGILESIPANTTIWVKY